MRRRTLIVITLIAVMLFSSFLPILEAQATTSTTTMTFNTDLYKGLKAYFQEVGIEAEYNDVTHTIKMDESVLNSIESISLKEKGISDISGIEYFKNVKSLILSANNISEESNLSVLNSLSNLTYLDLSSNNITDVSDIESLIMKLLSVDSNSLNISGQIASSVIDVELDLDEDKTTETFTLPRILEIAGIVNGGTIQNKGQVKADWFSTYSEKSSEASSSAVAPYIVNSTISNPVSSTNNTFDIQVGYEIGSTYIPYEGLVKFVISIKDTTSSSLNTNPASKNILKDSIFTLYYVVHQDDTEGIILKDSNLYKAVKAQLAEDQEVNTDLISYKYSTTTDGEIAYDTCEYTMSGTTAILKIDGTEVYRIYNFTGASASGTVYNSSTKESNYLAYKVIDVTSADDSGNVTTKRKVQVPHINVDCRDLYVDAYDEPQVLVILDLDLINKITSLILNDKRITDLSGIEKFVGLESNLNVSYNYIDTLANIYGLQKTKEDTNSYLQELFGEKKTAMSNSKNKVTTAYNTIDAAIKSIKEQIQTIADAKATMSSASDKTSSEYTNAEKVIQTATEAIYGKGDDDTGLMGTIDTALNDPQDGLNTNLSALYTRLANMYNVFNNEYRLTTILTPDLNYQTEEEYEAYVEQNKTLSGAKELAKAEISRIATLETANALSSLEESLIVSAFGLSLSDEQTSPISYALNSMVESYEETNATRTDWVNISSKFIEIGVYSEAANYCLIKRMNNDTTAETCYAEEYLEKIIENYTYEGILESTSVQEIYDSIVNGTATGVTTSLFNIFKSYITSSKTYGSTKLYTCKGNYYPVESLKTKVTESDSTISNIALVEVVNSETSTSGIFFYEQLMSLANKFTAIDETSLYITLPALKSIDVRNNEIESLGDTEVTIVSKDGTKTTTTENLASLTNLKELYAGHNFVSGDIACVDWSALTALKTLDLSYNYISDISPLEVLTHLRYLDVSDNLLAGEFNISLKKMTKLEDLILAGNKYTSIQSILTEYEMVAGGDFSTYFAREDTLNIDLSRQELEIVIEEPITYNSSVTAREVELPPIFAELEYIDAERTAFGTTSSKGSIQARGGVAYIPVSEVGDYTASVKVIAANGYPEEVSTSMGINTTCTIKYTVQKVEVTSIKINESVESLNKGATQNFTASVEGTNLNDSSVIWSVSGNTSANTTIDDKGVLTIAEDETAEKVTVTATSAYDNTKKASLEISINAQVENITAIEGIEVTAEKETVETGSSVQMTATVKGTDLTDEEKAVTWSVTGGESSDTEISETGLLTIASDETATSVKVVATSVVNPDVTGSKDVTITKEESKEPSETPEYGYTISSDKTEVIGISPDTTSANFKSKLVTDPNYTVEVRRNGETIADSDKVATSDIVVISKDGKPVDTYELVVKGDVNGDGVADALDSSLIKAYRAKLTNLSGAFLEAADINNDGDVSIVDIRLLLYHRARIDGYIL